MTKQQQTPSITYNIVIILNAHLSSSQPPETTTYMALRQTLMHHHHHQLWRWYFGIQFLKVLQEIILPSSEPLDAMEVQEERCHRHLNNEELYFLPNRFQLPMKDPKGLKNSVHPVVTETFRQQLRIHKSNIDTKPCYARTRIT